MYQYTVVTIFPFDSTRKMMSVIVKNEYQEYVIFSKGADTAMYERLDIGENELETLKMRSL